MTSRTGRPGSNRRKRRAFTLIELILVMAMLLIVVGITFPSLKSFFRNRTLDSEARRFLSLSRYAQSRAASEGIPMILWIDTQERTYGLQAQAGFLDLDRKAVEYDIDENLAVEVSAPPTGTPIAQRQRAAAQNANLPAIRITAQGYIEDTSPETIVFRQDFGGPAAVDNGDHSLWITQTGNRLNYEISESPPATFRR